MDLSSKIKHLEMIEAIIERMAKNSFQLKAWTITLVSAIMALTLQSADRCFMICAFVPIVGFWLLDSYYLRQERKYRRLYQIVAKKQENEIDFNLDASCVPEENYKPQRLGFFRSIFSISESFFYLAMIAVVVIIMIILKV